jgi:hypothetical protein
MTLFDRHSGNGCRTFDRRNIVAIRWEGCAMNDRELERLFIHPPYWMMFALPWPQEPGVTMAEAAFAFAPRTVSLKGLQKDVEDVLDYTTLYTRQYPGQRVVWVTDVTRWLDAQGGSWSALGVDWERALMALTKMPILGLFITVSDRAYSHLINTADIFEVHFRGGGSEILTSEERQVVHDHFERKLDADWPPYVQRMLSSGRLTLG